jgi:esterase/lipase superfamily enzyme
VFVPRSHKIGSLGSPWWRRLLTGVDDRLRLTAIEVLSDALFWSGLQRAMAACPLGERDIIVFVHGYNVSFEMAALRAAQIGFDLGFPGAMAFYSWPSQATLIGYAADAAAIEASTPHIVRFLRGLASESGASGIHLIAHSMGNRGVLRAVERIALEASGAAPVRFRQVILAAPDVDRDTFAECMRINCDLAERTTTYVSSRDSALMASHKLHQFPRAGLTPPVCVVRGVDTIDVADVDLSLLGHGYVAEVRAVLQDIHALVTANTPPASRFGIRRVLGKDGLHWTVGA